MKQIFVTILTEQDVHNLVQDKLGFPYNFEEENPEFMYSGHVYLDIDKSGWGGAENQSDLPVADLYSLYAPTLAGRMAGQAVYDAGSIPFNVLLMYMVWSGMIEPGDYIVSNKI